MSPLTLKPILPETTPDELSGDEFFALYQDQAVELVDGQIRELPMPGFRHSVLCNRIGRAIGMFVESHELGETLSNDPFIRVRRQPDTVFGPDLAFFSYQRIPKNHYPSGVIDIMPELVVEVRSPSNSTLEMLTKAAAYLTAGISVVLIVDSDTNTVTANRLNAAQQTFQGDDRLSIPDILPGFELPLAKLFA